jgi:hypothetical protein
VKFSRGSVGQRCWRGQLAGFVNLQLLNFFMQINVRSRDSANSRFVPVRLPVA